jgi:hypothetical protein
MGYKSKAANKSQNPQAVGRFHFFKHFQQTKAAQQVKDLPTMVLSDQVEWYIRGHIHPKPKFDILVPNFAQVVHVLSPIIIVSLDEMKPNVSDENTIY